MSKAVIELHSTKQYVEVGIRRGEYSDFWLYVTKNVVYQILLRFWIHMFDPAMKNSFDYNFEEKNVQQLLKKRRWANVQLHTNNGIGVE